MKLLEPTRRRDATLAARCKTEDEVLSPNVVKVVLDGRGPGPLLFARRHALRPRRPSCRGTARARQLPQAHRLYAYRRDFLLKFPTMPQAPLENSNRSNNCGPGNGRHHPGGEVDYESRGIDTPEDYAASSRSAGSRVVFRSQRDRVYPPGRTPHPLSRYGMVGEPDGCAVRTTHYELPACQQSRAQSDGELRIGATRPGVEDARQQNHHGRLRATPPEKAGAGEPPSRPICSAMAATRRERARCTPAMMAARSCPSPAGRSLRVSAKTVQVALISTGAAGRRGTAPPQRPTRSHSSQIAPLSRRGTGRCRGALVVQQEVLHAARSVERMTLLSWPPTSITVRAAGNSWCTPQAWQVISVITRRARLICRRRSRWPRYPRVP